MKRIIWIAAAIQFVLAALEISSRLWSFIPWGSPIGRAQIDAFVSEPQWSFAGVYAASLIIGAVLGWLISRTPEGSTPRQAARAGSLAGLGTLLGTVMMATVLLVIIGSDPNVQYALAVAEPHPEARIRADLVPLVGATFGIVGGGLIGLVGLGMSALGAWLGGLLANRIRQPEFGSAPRG